MTDLQVYSLLVVGFIGLIGLLFMIRGLLTLQQCKSAQLVHAEIVDMFQEYSSRGFLWKAKVVYERAGKEHFYITRARSFKRGTGTVPIYIASNGAVYERAHAISVFSSGIGIIIGAFVIAILMIL